MPWVGADRRRKAEKWKGLDKGNKEEDEDKEEGEEKRRRRRNLHGLGPLATARWVRTACAGRRACRHPHGGFIREPSRTISTMAKAMKTNSSFPFVSTRRPLRINTMSESRAEALDEEQVGTPHSSPRHHDERDLFSLLFDAVQ